MPGRALQALARARVKRCAVQLEGLEHAVLDQGQHFGPILKEALAALEIKLAVTRQRTEALDEVGPLRVQILWREIAPMVEALEDGVRDLGRLLQGIAARFAARGEEPENAYDELSGLERWFLLRLRHLAGESVSEGNYRCCACGAFNRPGLGFVLGLCLRCGGNCHHHVSSL